MCRPGSFCPFSPLLNTSLALWTLCARRELVRGKTKRKKRINSRSTAEYSARKPVGKDQRSGNVRRGVRAAFSRRDRESFVAEPSELESRSLGARRKQLKNAGAATEMVSLWSGRGDADYCCRQSPVGRYVGARLARTSAFTFNDGQ